MTTVSVAIPILNGARVLERTLRAVREQRLDDRISVELLVCDSGSSDESVAVARRHGAEVIQIRPPEFSHGGTRNLLMQRAAGDYVAFLTQDAVPADQCWLSRLLYGFSHAADVALVFGPYLPAPDASVMVARELNDWFAKLSPDGLPRVDHLAPEERDLTARELFGPRAYFTDANGCVSRAAWQSVPFRPVAYAEDHALAVDMLRYGYAKVFVPDAGVVHSHDYSPLEWLRRAFDESRSLHDVYGFAEPLEPRRVGLKLWGLVKADWQWAASHGDQQSLGLLGRSAGHHLLRTTGAVLGGRASRLPAPITSRLSLEGRPG